MDGCLNETEDASEGKKSKAENGYSNERNAQYAVFCEMQTDGLTAFAAVLCEQEGGRGGRGRDGTW